MKKEKRQGRGVLKVPLVMEAVQKLRHSGGPMKNKKQYDRRNNKAEIKKEITKNA